MSILTIILIVLMSVALCLYCRAAASGRYYAYIILGYLSLLLVTTLVGAYLILVVHVRNDLFLFHIYTPLEYTLLALLYSKALSNRMAKRVAGWSIPLFAGLSVLFSLYLQKTEDNNSLMTMIESLLLILWSLIYLLEVLLLQQVQRLQVYPLFWISVGILFYFAGSFTLEGLLNYMMRKDMALAQRVYRYGYIVKYLYLVLLMIGGVCLIREPRKS